MSTIYKGSRMITSSSRRTPYKQGLHVLFHRTQVPDPEAESQHAHRTSTFPFPIPSGCRVLPESKGGMEGSPGEG